VVRFEALAFLPWTFPNGMKFKCWCAYAPSSLGLTTASTHLLAYGLWPVLCPATVLTVSPPSAQSPFTPCGCDPHGGDATSISSENITPPSSLLRTHSPVAAASPLLRFSLVGGVCAGCHQSLLPAGPSRRYLRESFLGCWIPYPGGPTTCSYLFLPLCHRPSPRRAGSASRELSA